jgi:hypothetical protein
MTREAESAGAQAARALFRAEELPFPPLPHDLLTRLTPAGQTVFSTSPLTIGPYDLARHVQAFEANASPEPQAVIGFDGHGFNSWAMHCYVVREGLALFIQLPWGGAFMDRDKARADIADVLAWAGELQSRMEEARRAGALPAGRWLQVIASRLSHAGWRWFDRNDPDAHASPWQPAAGMKAALLHEAERLVRGDGLVHHESA